MSLNWNAQGTEWAGQPDDVKQAEWPRVESAIFLTMPLGTPRITAKNLPDVLKRLSLYCLLTGQEDRFKAQADIIRKLVGLSTNASPMTFAGFRTAMLKVWERDYEYEQRRKREGCTCGEAYGTREASAPKCHYCKGD